MNQAYFPDRLRNHDQARSNKAATVHLCLLATTDIHGHLLPFDYTYDHPVGGPSLSGLAPLIQSVRESNRNTLLFDNGDFLQGNPIVDFYMADDISPDRPHPAILAMNALGYEAASLGNHEFNFGLPRLKHALSHAHFPVTCANLKKRTQDETLSPIFAPRLLLKRPVIDNSGRSHLLRIGVIGLTPPQITIWDRARLGGCVESIDMLDAARKQIAQLRAQGADIVVVLAHTGIGASTTEPMMENAALPLARLPGIDALVLGHTHAMFPNAGHQAGTDPDTELLHGTPTVMPGANGSHLGRIDLILSRKRRGTWSVEQSRARLLTSSDQTSASPVRLTRLLAHAHIRARRQSSEPLGHTDLPLHSYLALVRSCPVTRLVNAAQMHTLRRVLHGSEAHGLPILSATASFRTGGRGGPANFVEIPAGPLTRGHLMSMYPFPNSLYAVRVSGHALRDWLERAASFYHQIKPGEPSQNLFDPYAPGHHVDQIDGITYQIDPSQPARYALDGRLIDATAHRITDLRHAGNIVREDQSFVLATNSYRVFGGGPYTAVPAVNILHSDRGLLRDTLAAFVREASEVSQSLPPTSWRFAPLGGTEVFFETGPGIRRYPQDLSTIGARDIGDTPDGFTRLALTL